jgi:hypothetical protein
MLQIITIIRIAPKAILCAMVLLFALNSQAQNVDIEALRDRAKGIIHNKKPFKFSGSINTNAVLYTGNAGSGRDPFNYLLSGSLSVNIYNSVSIPLSFTFTNRGFSYNYQFPNVPNRLSLHPKYRWITAHIGDVAMTFSPYTLNGHQFRGLGFDLTPKGNWRYSVMYGQLQKPVPYQPSNGVIAAYKRMGYGAKIGYDKGTRKAIVSFFQAKDELNSLVLKPDSLQIYPKQNTSISLETSLPLRKNLVWKTEYGISVLTNDTRAPKFADNAQVNFLTKLFGGRTSTNAYNALKTQLNYTVGSSTFGVGYERVDPGYQTLGAYYFNNDLENITLNFAQSLFKGKINIAGNVGYQRDDLDNKKSGGSIRRVGAVNLTYSGSKKMVTTFSYSNFQSYTNVKPQFQYINQLTPFNNLDTLDFRQISQNANFNINYALSDNKEKPQNLNINLSFQDAFDEQGGTISKGNSSQFFNFAGSWSISKIPKALTITSAVNVTYNTVGVDELLTLGPTLAINKQVFNKKVRTGVSMAYNTTINGSKVTNSTTSFRANADYVYKKKHNMGVNIVGMRSSSPSSPSRTDITATINYSYTF